MSLAAKTYIALILALGAAALGNGLWLWKPDDLTRFICYLLLAVPASCLKVQLPEITGTMSVSFVFVLAGIVELGLPETLIMGVCCVLIQSVWHAKVRPRLVQLLFAVANVAAAVWLADKAYHSAAVMAPSLQVPFRLSIAASAYFVANTFPVAAVIALTEGKSLRQVWSKCYFWSFGYYLVGAAIVGAFSFANRLFDWQVTLLILPVVYVIYRAYRLYLGQLQAERNQVQEANKHAEEVALLHTRGVEALASAMTANAKLDAAIEATSLAVLMLDRRGNVISWNSLAERIFGWSSEEALGRPVPFAEGLSQEIIQRMIAETLRGESVSGTELKQWRRDGSPFDAVVWTAPLHDPEGGISGILITVADVSDRKRLEDQLRLSQKMEAVGRLAGGVAHDFNNLLTVINGYSAMLVDSLKGNPHAVGQAAEILSAGTRAGELVSQLLAFSRRQMIKAKPIDINQLVQSVERMLRRIIGEHIEFRTELDPAAGWIRADPNQMEAVLLNLVTNAQDAMANGGVLSIGTAPVEVTPDRWSQHPELPVGSYVRLAVRDTGHGMDCETQQHVFEPFFTTKETGKGTGLGLSSVYGAIEQSGGRIIVDSKVGNGTTFSIYLPRCEAANSIELTQNLLSHSDPGSETILLVEDESAVRDMLREVLSKAGYKVWVSADGAEALGQWGSRIDEIDLVVSDIVMPVMNGLRLAEELRNRRPEIRVIFMSGHSLELINTQSLPDPAPDLLQKPFAPEALVRKVREILDHAPKPRRASNRSYSAATRPGS